ncbi:MAG: 1,6-anhydro-N-acetylmuramyl-L-alanine amidase AmpD [Moraxella sp.]|nr:1,6-anhydro-N-acetylmuramyl-L-alanine amidase AmpD [Moraxella sp.]
MNLPFSIQDGILKGVDFVSSPNFNARPDCPITGIVIHNISLPPSEFGKTDRHGVHFVKAFFQNQLNADDHPYFKSIANLEVSAHLLIERDGKMTQFVNFNDRAWHAGQSAYLGRSNCNDFTIGIELEGDDVSPFTDKQYVALAHVIVAIYTAYPATQRHLMGHSDIAPNRKTDPGACFDWQKIRQMVQDLILTL